MPRPLNYYDLTDLADVDLSNGTELQHFLLYHENRNFLAQVIKKNVYRPRVNMHVRDGCERSRSRTNLQANKPLPDKFWRSKRPTPRQFFQQNECCHTISSSEVSLVMQKICGN